MEGRFGEVRRRKVALAPSLEEHDSGSHVPQIEPESWAPGVGIGIDIGIAIGDRETIVPVFIAVGTDSERDWDPDPDADSDPETGSPGRACSGIDPGPENIQEHPQPVRVRGPSGCRDKVPIDVGGV